MNEILAGIALITLIALVVAGGVSISREAKHSPSN